MHGGPPNIRPRAMMVSTRVVFVGSAGIFGAAVHVRRVVVQFKKVRLLGEFDAAEVVFAVRVVVGAELRKRAYALQERGIRFEGQCSYAGVTTTRPPINVVRNASLRARMRHR